MPIVGGTSGNAKLQIDAELRVQDINRKLDALNRDFDKFAAHNRAAAMASQQAAKTATMGWTDFRSMYSTVLDVVRVGQQVWDATGQKFVDYAEQVKNMSRSLGASAEETSRLIQVADDVRLSYDTLKIAMKEAQKDGIDPNIEGLARLADQYKAIQDPAKKTQFLLDKFGKSGLEMGKLMEKGGAGIRAMSDSIDDALIMTEDGIKASDDYQKSLDNLNDSWDGLSMTIGKVFVPAANNAINVINGDIQALMTFNKEVLSGKKSLGDWAADIINNNPIEIFGMTIGKAAEDTEDFNIEVGDSPPVVENQKEAVERTTQALDDYNNMLKETSRANQEAESFIQNYADSQHDYVENHKDAVEELAEAQRNYNEAVHEFGAKSDQAMDEATNVEDAKKNLQDLEASWHESTQKMIYDMVMAKVSVDGLTDAEFKATQQLAVQMGIRTQAEADQANAMMDTATALADGIALQEDVMNEKAEQDAEQLRLEEEKQAASDATTQTIVDGSAASVESLNTVTAAIDSATQSYMAMAQAAQDAANATPAEPVGGSIPSQDMGGYGIAGQPYMIGRGAQPELFVPKTDGTFIPNADKLLSKTVNIVINNPRGMTAENSMRRALKQTSYLGYAV